MKPVNLIPSDQPGGAPSPRLATYAVLGVLALVVAMAAAYTLASRSVDRKHNELAATSARVDAVEAKAAGLKGYVAYANLRKARVERVQSLANSRYDWAYTLHEVARTIPSGTWVTSLRATTNPNVSVDGTADAMRPAISTPAVEVAGCSRTQSDVAAVIASLRQMSGVQRVTLTTSQKAAASATTDSAATGSACGTRPQFSLTVFLEASTGSTSAATGGVTP
jgi:Tfp pilus assembly protein PilN